VFAAPIAMGLGFGSALLADDPPAAASRAIWLPASLVYCALPMSLMGLLRMGHDGAWWVVLVCSVTWLNDTGAYFAGRAFGKHKMLPKASPKKTWEGFAGGMAASIASMFVIRAIGFPTVHLTPLDCLGIGIPAGILGPMGDLSESILKRALGVKDSGNILPGHGGMLDRIDALLFNSVLIFAYASSMGYLE
jgi:phosphatidate cytidylyltransferase